MFFNKIKQVKAILNIIYLVIIPNNIKKLIFNTVPQILLNIFLELWENWDEIKGNNPRY